MIARPSIIYNWGNEQTVSFDVAVIGAGPAGSAAAIRMRALGLSVALIERASFPRYHVGICIADQTVGLLQFLGLNHRVLTGSAWRRKATAVSWETSEPSLVDQPGFHVDRGWLDSMLIEIARTDGVTIFQPAQLRELTYLDGDGWSVSLQSGMMSAQLNARFVVDAAGRRPAIRSATSSDAPPLVAMHSRWTLQDTPEYDGLIEAGDNAWLWYAQTDVNQGALSIFLDPRDLSLKGESPAKRFEQLLSQFTVFSKRHLQTRTSEVEVCDAGSRHSKNPVSDHHIKVGDAAMSVDPLSSQGVHLALQSGVQSSVIANTIIKKPENTKLAIDFARKRIQDRVEKYTLRTQGEYAKIKAEAPSKFWRDRAGSRPLMPMEPLTASLPLPNNKEELCIKPDLVSKTAPVIKGDFVEREQVLRRPDTGEVVAFIRGQHIPSLLKHLPDRFLFSQLASHLPIDVAAEEKISIIKFLWHAKILERVSPT